MKKRIFTIVFVLSAISYGHAQQQGDININAGIDLGMPIGDFGEVYGLGYGATVKGLYTISDAGQLGLTLGYMRFGLKDDLAEGMSGSMGIIPIFALYRHNLGGFYLEPQVGLSVNSVSLEGPSGFGGSMSTSESSLGYAVGAGYLAGNFDVSVRYQGLTESGENMGFVGLRIGYNFGIGK